MRHVIPASLFRRCVQRVLLRKARYEVEKNLSRLAADWNERVAVVIEELRRHIVQAAQNQLNALAQMTEPTISNVPRLGDQVAELELMSLA